MFSQTRRQALNKFAAEAEYKRMTHQAVLDFDTVLDDILKPDYWATVASLVKPGSKIEAFRPDYSLDVVLRVTKVEMGLVHVRQISGRVDLEAEEAIQAKRAPAGQAEAPEANIVATPDELAADYKIGYTPQGDKAGFYAQFKPTKTMIAQGVTSKQAAIDKALAHKALATA